MKKPTHAESTQVKKSASAKSTRTKGSPEANMEKTTDTINTTSRSEETTTHPSRNHKINSHTVYFVIFVLAWALLSTIAGQYVASLLLSVILGEQLSQPGWMLLYYIISYSIAIALVILIPPNIVKIYRQRHDPKYSAAADRLSADLSTTSTSLGVQHLPTFIDIGLAPIGYVVYIFFANIITSIMSNLFGWFDLEQEQNVGFNYFNSSADQIFAMLAIVFVAPIAEEIIMRGWLYDKVRSKVKSVPIAIILVSLLFAVLHGQWNVGVTVFVLSVVLCTLREVTGTIWAGILLHMLSNGIAFYLLYVAA